ncbi:MAG: isoleucine--tRNA ligase [Candidatus Pacearchaeota archaeon]
MYDFKEVEDAAKELLDNNQEKVKEAVQDDENKEIFSFLEGPPTANAPPALHHLEVRTFKDIINKFKFMQGYSVPRKGGWDCHGLPVEVQVEKKLGTNSKSDVENYGVEKFTKKCRSDVWSNIEEWNQSTRDLDYWIDLENPYVTLDNNYIESVWWSLKELYNRKLLYEGYKILPYCTRCGTPLSGHEVAQGYKEKTEDSVYVAFKLKDGSDTYVLAWTTTPWTLPGNVALAVNPEITYTKIELPDGDKLILAKETLELIEADYKTLEEFQGSELVGKEYEPLYDIEELKNENSYQIVSANFVTTDEGTGVVHTAVMYGEDDYNLGKEKNLPEVHTVGQDGKFLDMVPKFLQGKYVKDADKDIINDLKDRKLLFKKEKTTHNYPHCWRCDTPLLYYGLNSWFVKVTDVKNRLVELNQEINWNPSHIKDGRFGKWLENAKDWTLSRFKFWGTPLPVWRCSSCNKEEIVGSIQELKEKANSEISEEEIDLHRPWVDNIKFNCDCGGEMERISDVIDCWYDSGAAHFAQLHYPFENQEYFHNRRYPYDYISEAIDQTRGWFYTMHVLSTTLFDKPAYKNVVCAGHVVDENGNKMSKSKGNVISPAEIKEKAGIDATRLQFFTADAGNQKRFSYNLMKEQVIPFLNTLYNCNKYYQQLHDKSPEEKIEDKWILSRLNSTVKEVTEELENFSLNNAFEKLSDFVVKDFSKGYIKMTRERDDTKQILGEVLEKVSLLLAPFAPHLPEYIFRNFSRDSIHLSEWPSYSDDKTDAETEEKFQTAFDIIEAGLAERNQKEIGLKWPLPKATIYSNKPLNTEGLEEIIKSQLNIRDYELKKDENYGEMNVELDTNLTPELEAEGYAREVSRKVQAFRKKLGLSQEDQIKLQLIVEEDLREKLEQMNSFLWERTNSKELEIETGTKEKFKNNNEFNIKGKRGLISIEVE